MKQLAQINLYPDGGLEGVGSLGTPTGTGVSRFAEIISMAIGVMTVVAIIWFLFTFITGAIQIIGSGGDKQALESARKKITTGIVGLIVVLLAIVITNLVGRVLGIENILNIGELLGKII